MNGFLYALFIDNTIPFYFMFLNIFVFIITSDGLGQDDILSRALLLTAGF